MVPNGPPVLESSPGEARMVGLKSLPAPDTPGANGYYPTSGSISRVLAARDIDPAPLRRRPQQDSNLRSRLRRASLQIPLTTAGNDRRSQLGRVWGVAAVRPVLSGWRWPGPALGGEALPGLTSGWLV